MLMSMSLVIPVLMLIVSAKTTALALMALMVLPVDLLQSALSRVCVCVCVKISTDCIVTLSRSVVDPSTRIHRSIRNLSIHQPCIILTTITIMHQFEKLRSSFLDCFKREQFDNLILPANVICASRPLKKSFRSLVNQEDVCVY
jgi:hypothetical protein